MEKFFSDILYFLPFAGLIVFRLISARRRNKKLGAVKKDPKAARTRPRGRFIRSGAPPSKGTSAAPVPVTPIPKTPIPLVPLHGAPVHVAPVHAVPVQNFLARAPAKAAAVRASVPPKTPPKAPPETQKAAVMPRGAIKIGSALSSVPTTQRDSAIFSRKVDALSPLRKALITAEILAKPRGW